MLIHGMEKTNHRVPVIGSLYKKRASGQMPADSNPMPSPSIRKKN